MSANGERDAELYEERLSAAIKRDAYSRPLRLDATALQTRAERVAGVPRVVRGIALGIAVFVGILVVAVGTRSLSLPGTGEDKAPLDIPMYFSESRFTPQVAFWGRLVHQHGCLELHWEGTQRMLAWPSPATEVRGDTIVLYGREIHVGDYLVVGGVEVMSPADPDDWVSPPSPGCWRERRVLVGHIRISTQDEVEGLEGSF